MNALVLRRRQLALHVATAVALCAAALAAPCVHAQSAQSMPGPLPVIGATSTIGNGADVTGAFTVNETAGANNAQLNQVTVSTGGAVANENASLQSASVAAKVTNAQASIEACAFSNTSGAVLVNQSAGAGNLQRNSTQLGTAALGVRDRLGWGAIRDGLEKQKSGPIHWGS